MKTGGIIAVGLGAVGLAGVAALLFGSKDAAAQPPAQAPGAVPGTAPVPNTTPPAGSTLVFVQDTTMVHLRQDQYYRGRLLLSDSSLPPFSTASTHDLIAQGLSAIGFTDVQVYMNVAALPAGWPPETAQNSLPGTRWFQGKWSGLTADVPRPWVVEQVWVTASPALAASFAAQPAAGIPAQSVAPATTSGSGRKQRQPVRMTG